VTLYEHVRVVAPGLTLRRQVALAAAARSLGIETSVDAELRTLRSELDSAPDPVPTRVDARRRVADAEAELEAKRERVATLRGRAREAGGDAAAREYRDAIRALSEAETEHAAATERLAEARSRARSARDARERRLRLEDRLGNAERTARRELLGAIRPEADAAARRVPGGDASAFEDSDPVSAAIALVRVGRVERPITLACGRFPDRDAAERWLDAPVCRIPPRDPGADL